ncbi:Signal transduction histidine kinase [Pricia antarctica]|uniref:histidine kinase n=1 Tax=Pricia antarctica TaxID=641691 RepID=A0A1G7EPF9_9FLAO|nr:Signal transduction histidine kinase [Pricia antarctica]
MTLRITIIICLLLLLSNRVTSQELLEHQIDSLQSIISRSNEAYETYNYKDVIKYGATLIKKGKEYKSAYATFLGYDMLGGVYAELDDTLRGRIYSEKALEIARISKSDSLIAWGTLNLGILFSDIPQTYQKAIRFFEESITINEQNNELGQVYLTYINLAWTHLDHAEVDKAYIVLKKARSIGNTTKVASLDRRYVELLFGRYYLAKQEYTPAIIQLESVAKEADRDSLTDLALETYEHLAIGYHKAKDYKNAFESLNKYNHYKQKAFTEEKIEETEKAKAKFNLNQTQKDLNAALKEKQYSQELVSKSKFFTTILIVATIILLFALLGFYLFFNTRKKYIRQLKTKNQELVLAKEKAEKLSKIKTRFLSTVSHELRTPLYGVIGISTLLKEDEKLKAYEEDLKSLKFSADYLLALVNDVLLLSKMDAEAIKLSQNPFKLDFLIQNIVRSFEFILQKNNNKLHLKIDKNIPNALIGDPIRLSQIVINLIGNAAKFNQDGNIWVALDLLKVTNKGLYQTRFTIKDDGPGIPLDKQKTVFEEFSQIEHTNHDYKGTGLGLTIVKKLLKLYKSKIQLESNPGEGSEFSFSLNLKKNTDEVVEKNQYSATKSSLADRFSNTDLHILIVDDNRINQKITQKILKRYHIRSSLADDGQQAIEMNRSQKFDMILMDINMPKINGMEAAKMILKIDKTIPIIALTAVELDEMRNDILNSGISDIIHKPYEVSEFLHIILKNLPSERIDLQK